MFPYRPVCILVIAGLMTTGCDNSQPYEKPVNPSVEQWETAAGKLQAQEEKPVVVRWWLSLHDKALNRLIKQAITNNYDLKIAQDRMQEAKAQLGKATAELLPEIDVTAGVGRAGSQQSNGGSGSPNSTSQIGVNANWDPDFFGGKHDQQQAQQANIGATQALYRQTLQALLADMARTYIDLRAQQQLLELTDKNLTLQNDTLNATRIQYEAHAASKLDLLRAQAQAKSTASEIPAIRAALAAKRYHIAVLSGEPPARIDVALKRIGRVPVFSDAVVMATPIEVMASRPDIEVAELRLQEQTALKNARSADIFPKLTLAGFFGAGTSSVYPSATPWSLAANLAAPLLDFGRIQSDIDAADARKQQAFHFYQKTVLEALEETQNALIQYSEEQKRFLSLTQSADSQREAAQLARIKFGAGDAAFIDVLTSEETLLQAESAAVQSNAALSRAAVNLYTAMGVVAPADVVSDEINEKKP